METIEKLAKVRLIIGVIAIDLIVLLGAALLVTENQQRWPILLGVGPILFFVNLNGIQQLKRKTERRQPIFLAVTYGCGTLLALYWVIEDFQWWKCISLAVALLLLGAILLAKRNALNNKG